MSNPAKIRCAHCGQLSEPGQLVEHQLGRSELGVDVFACPNCGGEIKIDPDDFAKVHGGAAVVVESVDAAELTSAEVSIAPEQRSVYPMVWIAIAVVAMVVYLLV